LEGPPRGGLSVSTGWPLLAHSGHSSLRREICAFDPKRKLDLSPIGLIG